MTVASKAPELGGNRSEGSEVLVQILFYKADIFSVKESQKRLLRQEISRLTEAQVMNTDLNKWVEHLCEKFSIEPIVFDEQGIYVEKDDVEADASRVLGKEDYFFGGRYEDRTISATEFVFHVPYAGETALFNVKPSTFDLNPPRADILDGEVLLKFVYAKPDAKVAKANFDQSFNSIKRYATNLQNDLKGFDDEIRSIARSELSNRFEKLKKDNDVAAELGFPLKKRGDPPRTYIVPNVKRKITPKPIPITGQQSKPEPTLEVAEYEHILSVARNMVTVIEQSPHSFKSMDEESIRTHFLVQLNGQYEGQATGETFNFEGKTDIIIKDAGKNIFIAECKFWKGGEVFLETIDQLLGYLSWRDTKAAIFIFNRNKNLSNVLSQIPGLIGSHSNFVRKWKNSERNTEFKYVLHQKSDKNREIYLTVQVYEMPI